MNSTYHLTNRSTRSLVDSLGQEIETMWRSNFSKNVPYGIGVSYFYPDRLALVLNDTKQFQQNPCDVSLGSDTFSRNELAQIQPNGLRNSTCSVSISGRPNVINEYDYNRLLLSGFPFAFTHFRG